jgi:hypothetical protein
MASCPMTPLETLPLIEGNAESDIRVACVLFFAFDQPAITSNQMRVLFLAVMFAAVQTFASEPLITKASSGRFTITQRWVKPDFLASNTDCNNSDCGWQAVLQFSDKSKPEAALAAAPEWYEWPADYRVSPDEQWIIREQKTGSGENALFLYRIQSNGQLWRLTQHLDDLVFAFLLPPLHRTRSDYYHMEVLVESWDIGAGRLLLRANATPNDKNEKALIKDRRVIYDFMNNVVSSEESRSRK